MVTPALRREWVRWVGEAYQLSERRACRATGVARALIRYRSRRPPQTPLRARLRELAESRVSFGYKRLHVLLRREGWPVNVKRVHRLYRQEGLALRRRPPKRRGHVPGTRAARSTPTGANQRWGMDFIHDQLADGRPFRVFVLLDVCTRECLALVPQPRFRGEDICRVLRDVVGQRGAPAVVQCDRGTEFTSLAVDHWAYFNRVTLDFSRPATPTDNAAVESFNASLRRECLSHALVTTPADVEQVLDAWRADYNAVRPHTSLGHRSPADYRAIVSPRPAVLDRRRTRGLTDRSRGEDQSAEKSRSAPGLLRGPRPHRGLSAYRRTSKLGYRQPRLPPSPEYAASTQQLTAQNRVSTPQDVSRCALVVRAAVRRGRLPERPSPQPSRLRLSRACGRDEPPECPSLPVKA